MNTNHEGADTRIILHARDATLQGYQRCVLQCRDTDVLVVALGLRDHLSPEVWFSSGLKSKRPFIPIHHISLPEDQIQTIIAFHALTGCDTVSQFAGIGKKTALKVFTEESACLQKMGSKNISDQLIQDAEKFVCKLYLKTTPLTAIDQVRREMFLQGKRSLDALLPSKDALEMHIRRANYQCLVWKE